MNKQRWHNKRIPTIAALLSVVLIFASIWVTSLLIQQGIILEGRAGPLEEPKSVLISNVTDNSFTVSFTTGKPTVAALSVATGTSAPFLALDTRSTSAADQEAFSTHYITVTNLSQKTPYTFTILSDGETYLNNGQGYNITTGATINATPNTEEIHGRIEFSDGSAAIETIVTLQVPNGQILSSLTSTDGGFSFPTNTIRSSGLTNFITLNPKDKLKISALNQNEQTTINVLFEDSSNIPTIILGNNYNFTEIPEVRIATSSSQLEVPQTGGTPGNIRITTPRASQSFVDQQPRFTGTAVANKSVRIILDSKNVTTVTSTGQGTWSFRPESPIAPGAHTLTIITTNNLGISQSVSSAFSIFPSGTQVSQTATPSATIVPSPTPSRIPTPTVTVRPSPTPTRAPTPTVAAAPTVAPTTAPNITPTVAPTATLPTPTTGITPTVAITIAPTQTPITAVPTKSPIITPPAPGANTQIMLTAVSFALIVAGSVLLFLL